MPIPVAARFKAWVYGYPLAGIAVSNPAGGMDVCPSLVNVVCCQVEASASGRSLVQKSPTDCFVFLTECDHGVWTIRTSRPTGAVAP